MEQRSKCCGAKIEEVIYDDFQRCTACGSDQDKISDCCGSTMDMRRCDKCGKSVDPTPPTESLPQADPIKKRLSTEEFVRLANSIQSPTEPSDLLDEILLNLANKSYWHGVQDAHHDSLYQGSLTDTYQPLLPAKQALAHRERLIELRVLQKSLSIVQDHVGGKWWAAQEIPQPGYDTFDDVFHYGAEYVIGLIKAQLQAELKRLEEDTTA